MLKKLILVQDRGSRKGSSILRSVKAVVIAATITVAMATSQLVPGSGVAFAGQDGRTDLKIAMPSTWASHGPTVNTTFGARVTYSIYDTLVWRNYLSKPDGSGAELVPGLATSWKQVSPTEWDFTIRQGVKFHDGTTMTTEDVAYSLNNTYGDGTEPFAASGTLKNVVAIDANTVRITTKNPDPALLARMATVMGQVYPKAYYERVGREVFGREPIGTGPYKWAGRVTGEYVKLEAFDDYWGDKPPLASITFLEVPEVSARIAGLLTGEYDIATSLPPDQTRPIDNDANTEIRAARVENIQMITFRQWKEGSPVADKRVRKAMVLAFDRPLLAEKLWGGLTEAGTYDFPGYGKYYQGRKALPYDPEEAKRLLAEAGYNGEEIVIRIVSGYYTNMNRAMQAGLEMWKKVGLNVRLDFIENWGQMGKEGDAYNTSDHMWMTDPGGGMWFSWGREGGHRLQDWVGGKPPAEFLKLGTAIEQGSDFATRKAAYDSLLELWDDLVPAIILYRAVEAYGVRKSLDWKPYTFFYIDFRANNVKDNG